LNNLDLFIQLQRKMTFTPKNPQLSSCYMPDRLFLLFCTAHLLLWTTVPTLLYESVPRDTLEGIAWGRLWAWGYDKHPPLAAWLSAAATDIFGVIGWPVYLTSQLCVVLCFTGVWLLAKQILKPHHWLAAILLLEGITYYNITSFTLNPNIVMLPTWAMLSLTFYNAIKTSSNLQWIYAGIWAGLAFLAKYESGLLFLVLLGVMFGTKEGRSHLIKPGFYIGLLTASLIALPNLIWQWRHNFISLNYIFENAGIRGVTTYEPDELFGIQIPNPLFFFLEQAGQVLPCVLLFFLSSHKKGVRFHFDVRKFEHIYIMLLTLMPLLVIVTIGAVFRAHLVSRWGFPFFSMAGIAMILFFYREDMQLNIKKLITGAVGFNLLLVVILYAVIYILPLHTGRPPSSMRFPTRPLAELVTREWHGHYGVALPYVAGDRFIAAGIAAYSSDKPVAFFDWDLQANPDIDERELAKKGAVFVHYMKHPEKDDILITQLKARYPGLQYEHIVELHQLLNVPLSAERFWVAYLPPSTQYIQEYPKLK
jgi:4-amino-4-deoxy-L-arabinose transferase-like glycosyltransferase